MNIKLLSILLVFTCFNLSAQVFENVNLAAGIDSNQTQVLDVLDFNNDGWEDLLMINDQQKQVKLFKNVSGKFYESTVAAGLPVITAFDESFAAFSFDYNADGFQDICFVQNGFFLRLFRNNCGNTFSETTVGLGIPQGIQMINSPANGDPIIQISDIERDGDLDLVFTRIAALTNDRIVSALINDGNQFTVLTDLITGFGNSANPILSIGDFDNNGADDILIIKRTNETAADEIFLYENNLSGGFSFSGASTFPLCSNIGFANLTDLNNDGLLDILLGTKEVLGVGSTNNRNKVFFNAGNFTFTDATLAYDTYETGNNKDYINSFVFDLENDGDLDVFWQTRSNLLSSDSTLPILQVNNGSNVFTAQQNNYLNAAFYNSMASKKFMLFDYNNDGLLDIFKFGDANKCESGQLLKNTNNNLLNRFISVKLLSCNGSADARGARLYVKAGNIKRHKHFGSNALGANANYGSEKMVFGLGKQNIVDSLIIYWPNGSQTIKTGFSINQQYTFSNVYGCNKGATLTLNLGPDTLVNCNQDTVKIIAPLGFDTYLWSNGSTDRTNEVLKEGWYTCTAGMSSSQCFATDSIYVKMAIGKIVQNDTLLCAGSPLLLNAFPTFNCNPFGAPQKLIGYLAGQTISGYQYLGNFQGHYYYKALAHSGWNTAAQQALNAGGNLAVINSEAEQRFLLAMADNNLWLGLFRDASNRSFRWMNCDRLDYSNFKTNEPTDMVGEDYIYLQNKNCVNAGFWQQHTESDNLLADTCLNTMYGLLEIDPEVFSIAYTWSTGATSPSIVVSPNNDATYLLSVKKGNTTCTDAVKITIPKINGIISSDTLKTCNQDSVWIQAQNGFNTYLWNTGATSASIYATTSGWHKVKVSSNGGCFGFDSVYALINNASIRTPDTAICINTPFQIRGPKTPAFFVDYYSENFSGLPPFNGFNKQSTFTFNGSKVLGFFHNDTLQFKLGKLIAHDSVEIAFDLYIHDTWEGDCSITGPDQLAWQLDQQDATVNTFSNNAGCTQSYSTFAQGNFPAKQDAATVGLARRCFNDPSANSTLYRISKKFAHQDTALQFKWIGTLVDTELVACNESWSIDNVQIRLRKATGILWSTGDTTENIQVHGLLTNATYWARVGTPGNYCFDTVKVTVNNKLSINFLPDTTYYCGNLAYDIQAPDGFEKYSWSNGDQTANTQFKQATWYRVTINKGGCAGTDSSFFAINRAQLSQDTFNQVCMNNPTLFNINWNDNCNPYGGPVRNKYTNGSNLPGYTYLGRYLGHYYYAATTRSNWSDAAKKALSVGGYLAIINDTAEQKFIQKIVKKNVWLGMMRNQNNEFVWMNCDPATYTNWNSNAPSNNQGEDFVYMMNSACAEPFTWNTMLDDDNAANDPCYSQIYGLLEIVENKNKVTWLPSNQIGDSLLLIPKISQQFTAIPKAYNYVGDGACAFQIRTVVEPNNFHFSFDSIVKLSCESDTIILTAPDGFDNYNWSNGETGNPIVLKDYTGWIYCEVVNNNCRFKDSVWIELNPPLKISISKEDITCYNDNNGVLKVKAIGGKGKIRFNWQPGNYNDTLYQNIGPGTYTVTASDEYGCSVIDSAQITNPTSAIQLQLSVKLPITCFGKTNGSVKAIVSGGATPYQNSGWVGYGSSQQLVQLPKGFYTYSITDQRGCIKTDSIELIEPEPVAISAEVLKQLVCESDTDGLVLLTPYGGRAPYRFTWNGKATKDSLMRSLQAGNFKAVVTDSMGCKDSVELSLDGIPTYKCGLFFPEGFSPNGDGKNDFFMIKGILDFPENELSIYNRWGELVYHTFNYNNTWDGKASVNSLMSGNNGYLPNDTYYYVFTSKSNNKSFSGYIYLIR